MKEIKFFCDICNQEFMPNEYCFLTGQIIKVDKELKPHATPVEEHFCGKCTNQLLEHLIEKKNENNNQQK